jgi:hypothetical protein
MRKVLFSVCLGDYDNIPPLMPVAGYESIMITDNPDLKCAGWEKLIVPRGIDNQKRSRRYKLLPHELIDADVYAYIDANQEIRCDLNPLLESAFKGGFLTSRHPNRACVYDEAERIKSLKKAKVRAINAQTKAYRREGLPENTGLFANGFFVRDRSFDKFCERWYEEIEKYTYRDQLSLAYLVWKYEPQITVIDASIRDFYLRTCAHKDEKKARPDIWYFVPGCGHKDLGSAINRHCEIVPDDDDWILVRDNDTAFLHPFINKQLEDIIAKHGHKYDLLSCYTNRLGLAWQLPYGLSDNPDILHHRELAEKHYAEHYDEVIPADKATAGLFMLFQKKTWSKHPFVCGLASNGDFIDYQFSNGLLQNGLKIGICSGIYMFHYYRMHQSNWREHEHLMA